MEDRSVKQVIVMRKDLKMRRGKEISQGAHAAMAWMSHFIRHEGSTLTDEQEIWILGTFTKITCQVNSEEELMAVYNAAVEAGLTVHLVTDAGKTEFNGKPTKTCICVGPNYHDEVEKVCGHLQLY